MMGNRYWITGVQLGIILGLSVSSPMLKDIKKLVDNIIDKQFLCNKEGFEELMNRYGKNLECAPQSNSKPIGKSELAVKIGNYVEQYKKFQPQPLNEAETILTELQENVNKRKDCIISVNKGCGKRFIDGTKNATIINQKCNQFHLCNECESQPLSEFNSHKNKNQNIRNSKTERITGSYDESPSCSSGILMSNEHEGGQQEGVIQNKSEEKSLYYKKGYDSGLNGANTNNSHFSLFTTPEKTKEWSKGRKQGEICKTHKEVGATCDMCQQDLKEETKIEVIENDDGTAKLKFNIPEEERRRLQEICDRNKIFQDDSQDLKNELIQISKNTPNSLTKISSVSNNSPHSVITKVHNLGNTSDEKAEDVGENPSGDNSKIKRGKTSSSRIRR